jgi:membrane-associated PAP2 superfamily phosphatase
MSYIRTLAFEILVVALVTALALALAVSLNGPIHTRSHALWTGLIIGAVVHSAFELFGGNLYYCSFGAACGR